MLKRVRGERDMGLCIVNADPRYSQARLIEPTTLGYIHVAAEAAPRRLPFLPDGHEKSELLSQVKRLAHDLAQLAAVERVTVFDAIAFAPPSAYVKARGDAVRVAHFDIVALIETTPTPIWTLLPFWQSRTSGQI